MEAVDTFAAGLYHPGVASPELRDARFQRTEQSGTSLLLRAIPQDQQQSLIAAREMNSIAILYWLMVRFQPGGAGEKALLLAKLITSLDATSDVETLTSSLRTWFTRALEIRAIIPDGTLLLQALESGIQLIASRDNQTSFRLPQSRCYLHLNEKSNSGQNLAFFPLSTCRS